MTGWLRRKPKTEEGELCGGRGDGYRFTIPSGLRPPQVWRVAILPDRADLGCDEPEPSPDALIHVKTVEYEYTGSLTADGVRIYRVRP